MNMDEINIDPNLILTTENHFETQYHDDQS